MKTARNQFGDAVGIALDAAVVGGVPSIELISYLGSYIDIVMHCNGGGKKETALMLVALSEKYRGEDEFEQLTGQPIFAPMFSPRISVNG